MPKFLQHVAITAVLLALSGITPGDANSQQKQDPAAQAENPAGYVPSTIKVVARIVVLDVVVTDKKGNLVHRDDLKPEDFQVYEDKVPQTIRSFEPPSQHRMPVSATAIVNSAADLKKIGDAPVTLLVLDELNSRFEDMSFSRQMMLKYLQSQPAVLKEPTVLLVATLLRLSLNIATTAGPRALLNALKIPPRPV